MSYTSSFDACMSILERLLVESVSEEAWRTEHSSVATDTKQLSLDRCPNDESASFGNSVYLDSGAYASKPISFGKLRSRSSPSG